MNKSNLNIFTYDYYPWKYPRNWFRNIRQFFRNTRWAWQRATKGFADRDTWNLDFYYAELFADSLKHLAENGYGYPNEFTEFNTKDTPDAGAKEWQKLLLEASENFRNYNNENVVGEFDLFKIYADLLVKKQKESENSKEVKKAAKDWQDAEENADKFRSESLDKGLDFLKKWFKNLWD